jgi:hypothetical protein
MIPEIVRALQSISHDTEAGVATVGAIVVPVLLGASALGITYQETQAAKSRLQAALDSAVLAGAPFIDAPAAAEINARTYLGRNFSDPAATQTELVAEDYRVEGTQLIGHAVGRTANPFAGLPGLPTHLQFSVTATAVRVTTPICILGLNPLDKGSMDMNGTSRLSAPSCIVQFNSNNALAMTQEGNPFVEAKRIRVKGGCSGTGYNPAPEVGKDPVADPYASLLRGKFPPRTPCAPTDKTLLVQSNTTLKPGTYCGGIHMTARAEVTMMPGVYVMDGGPLWLNGGASLVGRDVTIAFTGKDSTLYAEGNSMIDLTSPKSGTYKNIQFFQDPNQYVDPKSGLWFSVGGGRRAEAGDTSKLTIDGLIYVPRQNVWIYGEATAAVNSPAMAMVTEKLWLQGKAKLSITNKNARDLSVDMPAPQITTEMRLAK